LYNDAIWSQQLTPAQMDFELFRASSMLDSDPGAAAHTAAEILKEFPGNPAASLLLAMAVRRRGDASAALALLEGLALEQPDSAVLRLDLARAYDAAQRPAEALSALRRVVQIEPDLAEGWRELSQHLAADGDSLGADLAYARCVGLTPGMPGVLTEAAMALRDGRLAAAEALLRRHQQASPADVDALRMLAEAAARREDYALAEQLLEQCLTLAPGYSGARYDLAQLFLTQQKPGLVLPLAERLLKLDPANLAYRRVEASAYSLLGRHERSIQIWEGMLADSQIAPPQTAATLWMNYGHELKAAGRSQDAIDAYRKSIALDPFGGAPYWSLANMKTYRFEEPDIEAIRQALQHDPLRADDRVHFEFSLGKALEDGRRYEEAFAHYAAGNALQRMSTIDLSAKNKAFVSRARATYSQEFFAARAGWGSDSVEPIFIVGLPRAGSTLLEQILASHSQVEGTRELADITAIARKLGGARGEIDEAFYVDAVAALDAAQVRSLADQYLDATRVYRLFGRPRFIDKMPNNFLHLGLIHLMFPRASIIDARRHPLGCCFSCFKQHFAKGQFFTYDLQELALYYRLYAQLMDHFDTVLPGRVYRVYYEQVVADLERNVRKLLDYCSLPFETGCLRFHETRRSVQTASSEQVRRPIYSEGADQWRHFEPWLGTLKEALGDIVERYPAGSPP
jgi:tetratricopeptide (TPR) repeat protein